jgi:hypothetical protein
MSFVERFVKRISPKPLWVKPTEKMGRTVKSPEKPCEVQAKEFRRSLLGGFGETIGETRRGAASDG